MKPPPPMSESWKSISVSLGAGWFLCLMTVNMDKWFTILLKCVCVCTCVWVHLCESMCVWECVCTCNHVYIKHSYKLPTQQILFTSLNKHTETIHSQGLYCVVSSSWGNNSLSIWPSSSFSDSQRLQGKIQVAPKEGQSISTLFRCQAAPPPALSWPILSQRRCNKCHMLYVNRCYI